MSSSSTAPRDCGRVVEREIPDYRVVPTRHHLFMFSAATWNRHHVHFDADAARGEGLPDVVVHRALLGNFLGQLLERWLGGNGTVRRLEWKVRRSALPGRPLLCSGEVVENSDADNAHSIRCALRITDPEGEVIVAGSATVELDVNMTWHV